MIESPAEHTVSRMASDSIQGHILPNKMNCLYSGRCRLARLAIPAIKGFQDPKVVNYSLFMETEQLRGRMEVC